VEVWWVDVEHQIQDGWTLIEGDVDLFGRVQVYRLKDSSYDIVRTPNGWRARLTANGHAKRAFKSANYESAPAVVAYLVKWRGLRHQ